MSNEGMWIKVTNADTGRRVAVNLLHVITVRENDRESVFSGKKALIDFSDGTTLATAEDFDQIGEMIR